MLLAASLSLLLAAGLSIGAAAAAPGSGLYPFRKALERMVVAIAPDGATVRLRIAEARLDDLMTALRRRDFNLAPGLSGDLVAARRAAASVGASTTSLDERIARDVPPMLAGAPDSIQRSVRGILGTLLPPMVDARRTEPADQVFGSDHPTGAEASSAGDVDDQGQERDSDEGGGDDPEEEADGDDPQGPPEEGDDDEGPDPDDDEGDDDEGDDEEGQDPEDRD